MKFIYVTLLCLVPSFGFAQTENLVSSAGIHAIVDDLMVDVSIGDAVIGSFSTADVIFSQGYLMFPNDGAIAPTIIPENRIKDFSMSPNPVADMTLVLGVEPSETLFLYVYDVQGKLVNKHAFVQSDINLSQLKSGQYLVIIRNTENTEIYKTKIIKL